MITEELTPIFLNLEQEKGFGFIERKKNKKKIWGKKC